jgi:hypothetical protein
MSGSPTILPTCAAQLLAFQIDQIHAFEIHFSGGRVMELK